MKIITRYHRPSTDIAWWTEIMPEYIKEHYKTAYMDPGFRLSERFELSEDGLTLSHIAEWIEDANVLIMWLEDPVINEWKRIRGEYCDSVNIVKDESINYYGTSGDSEPLTK